MQINIFQRLNWNSILFVQAGDLSEVETEIMNSNKVDKNYLR